VLVPLPDPSRSPFAWVTRTVECAATACTEGWTARPICSSSRLRSRIRLICQIASHDRRGPFEPYFNPCGGKTIQWLAEINISTGDPPRPRSLQNPFPLPTSDGAYSTPLPPAPPLQLPPPKQQQPAGSPATTIASCLYGTATARR
jgi:hypothetical protein